MKRMLFIFNPYAGKGMIKNQLFDIVDVFARAGYETVVHPTCEKGDLAKQILDRGGEYDIITVSGGDGTINEAAGAILQLPEEIRPVIGYIPAGSTNDFASNLGLPSDMKEAAVMITKGKEYSCDVGMFNDKPFVYVAAAGMMAEVSYDTPQGIKNILGHSAYVLEAMMRLPDMNAFALRLKCGDDVYEGSYILFMILNSVKVGGIDVGGIVQADISDGVFEAVLVERPASFIELEQTMVSVLKGERYGRGFKVVKGNEFDIEMLDSARWTLDGELGGEYRNIHVSVIQNAIRIIGKA